MAPYIASWNQLVGLFITWGIAVVLTLFGAGLGPRRCPVEVKALAGWGAFCLLETVWGVLLPFSLRIPALAFVAAAVGVLAWPRRRPSAAEWVELGRMAAVSLPLWLAMAPVRPAEPDTWLNLLPNAMYLVDYGVLPTASRPPSFSFLPAAPYNTQFLSFLGAIADPDFPPGGMSLLNLMLVLLAGMLLGRSVLGSRRLGWAGAALGLLLATLFNPGFVPRIHLSAYGETGLAVTALAGAWLSVRLEGGAETGGLLPLGLVLAAMVNVKQSGFGLVAASAGAMVVTGLAEDARSWRRTLGRTIVAVLPALFLWVLWRLHVARAGVDELKPLPLALWQWGNIPAILASMAHDVASKGVYFGCVAAALVALPLLLRKIGWTETTRFLTFHAALLVLYTGFLVLTYIGHFPGSWSTEAHSFFRYETHLSFVLVMALALAVREIAAIRDKPWLASSAATRAIVLLALAAPIAFAKLLRFDLAPPQPLAWTLTKNLVPFLNDKDRLAVLLPGDNGSVATMLTGVLENTPPRRRQLDVLRRDRADTATLADAARLGYPLAFVSCTPPGLDDVPAGQAALLGWEGGMWRPLGVWSYPERMGRERWQHVLSWQPLCRDG